MAVYQSNSFQLNHRYREQAPSHIDRTPILALYWP